VLFRSEGLRRCCLLRAAGEALGFLLESLAWVKEGYPGGSTVPAVVQTTQTEQ
jgi:hypothetical protein